MTQLTYTDTLFLRARKTRAQDKSNEDDNRWSNRYGFLFFTMRSNIALTLKMTLKQRSILDMLEKDMLYSPPTPFSFLVTIAEKTAKHSYVDRNRV